MKRVLIILFALSLIVLLTFSTSAQSFGTDEPLIPYLNYTLTADEYTIHAPSIQSGGGQTNSWVFGNNGGRINDVSIVAIDPTLGTYGDHTTAETELYYDFVDSTDNISGDPYRPSTFDIRYSPFSIKFGDVFQYTSDYPTTVLDSFTFFDTIGAIFDWYGADSAYVESEIVLRVYYVQNQYADGSHGVVKFQPLAVDYRIDFQGDFNDIFSASTLDVDGMSFYNLTKGMDVTFDQLYKDILGKTVVQRKENDQTGINNIYLDVQSCYLRINSVNAPFSGLLQTYAPYISVDGYNYVNGSLFNPSSSSLSHRQQYMSVIDSLVTANKLNQHALDNIDFGDNNNPIVRVPALFLNAVSAFFDIDFFGLGFTIGNVIGVIALALMVVIFLRLFAGG